MSSTSETDTSSATPQVVLAPIDAETLWDAVGRLIGDRDLEILTPDELVDLGLVVPSLLPPDVRRRIIEFRRRAPGGDVLLLRGLLPNHVAFPPTPEHSSLPVSDHAPRVVLLLIGVMTLFGEPFTYDTLWDGRLVPNLVPVRSKEFTQTSQSSTGMLDWHVEDGYREDRCDHLGLICLRADPTAASKYAQAKDLQLSPELAATLRQPRFQLRPDPAHVLPDNMPKRRIAVLTGPESAPEIVYDTHHIEPVDDSDDAAAAALRDLHERLNDVQIEHVMEPGDLMIFDNKRVVHARAPFTARFDGTDRWLMRVMVCGSAVTFRRWGHRITH
jgi:L-asparagine oxygenase